MNTGRRRILLAAATAALTGLPRAPAAEPWDLVVVGGGTAGLPTALFAAERGRVLVVEKAPLLGGTLDRSTGQVAAAGTVFQAARGIEDTPEAHYADIMRINGGTSDPALTRLFVEHAGAALNWLAANGYRVEPEHPVTGYGHEHFRTPRYQWGAKGGWSIFEAMQPLVDRAQRSGQLELMLNTAVTELIIDRAGAVAGVVAQTSDGGLIDLPARNVVLASGGCAANPVMFEELHGVPLYCRIAHPNSQGIGISLGLAAGGKVRGGDKYLPLAGAVLDSDDYPAPPTAIASLNPTLRPPWEIIVNASGERFVREDEPSIHHIEEAIALQPGHRHWVVFDREILKRAPPLLDGWTAEKLRAACASHPMFSTADSIGELAERAGLPAGRLIETVEAYNRARSRGRPDPLGLQHRPLPIAQPPYYAVAMHGWTVISFAGLNVNARLQVLRVDGRPVPNLYAAGEVIGAGATSGRAYTNGMLVTPAITFGRLLGREILPLGEAVS